MRFDLQQWEIKGLSKNYKLLDIPPFQREEEIWSPKKQQLFIDTILKGWRIPKIYLHNTASGRYEIVDGLQRISTILRFLNNDITIKSSLEDKDLSFNSLDPSVREQVLRYKLDVEIVKDASDDEISELFSRLQEGVALNQREKLNALTGKLSEFIKLMEDHPFFVKTGFRKRRYGIKGVCQQLFLLEVKGIGSAKFPALWEFFETNREFDDNTTKKKVIQTLDYLNEVFQNEEEYLTKSGNVLSIYMICSWLISNEANLHPRKAFKFFNEFYTDFEKKTKAEEEYYRFYLTLLQSTADASAIKLRDDVLKRKLCIHEPMLLEKLQLQDRKEFYDNLEDIFSKRVDMMYQLMIQINERAISIGKDAIFDMTAQSGFTLKNMSKIVKNEADYKTFIDETWKVFYEGSNSGNRIDSFTDDRSHRKLIPDINILIKLDDLRKVKAHDLEHDRETYAEKIRIASNIRDFYVGKKLVTDFNENDFLVFQHSGVVPCF